MLRIEEWDMDVLIRFYGRFRAMKTAVLTVKMVGYASVNLATDKLMNRLNEIPRIS